MTTTLRPVPPAEPDPLLREVFGEILRHVRRRRGRTLREVAQDSRISLAYLSEVERGQKEASSEILAAVCTALGISVLDLVSAAGEVFTEHDVRRAPIVVPTRTGTPSTVATAMAMAA